MNIKFQGNPLSLKGEQLKKGDTFKDFTVLSNDLSPLSFKDTSGVRIFLSVPSIDTPVCDMESIKFDKEMQELDNVSCFIISMDLPFAQTRWVNEKGTKNITLLSDFKDKLFSEATGTYINELGLTTRACFVVDSNNKLIYVDYLEEITNEPNYTAIIETVKSII